MVLPISAQLWLPLSAGAAASGCAAFLSLELFGCAACWLPGSFWAIAVRATGHATVSNRAHLAIPLSLIGASSFRRLETEPPDSTLGTGLLSISPGVLWCGNPQRVPAPSREGTPAAKPPASHAIDTGWPVGQLPASPSGGSKGGPARCSAALAR